MSSNKLINAMVALVEERPKDVREMLRSPELKLSVGEVQSRLASAIRKRENKAKVSVLKQVLNETIRIDMSLTVAWSPQQRESYLQGVAYVEEVIDDLIEDLDPKPQVLPGPYPQNQV